MSKVDAVLFNHGIGIDRANKALNYSDVMQDYIASGLLPVTSTTLSPTIPAGTAYVAGQRVQIPNTTLTLPSRSMTWVDVRNDDTLVTTSLGTETLVESCDAAWSNLGTGITQVADKVTYKVGAGAVELDASVTIAAGTVMAYNTIPATDISTAYKIRFWIMSSVGVSANYLQLLLDDTATLASPVYTINIPALTPHVWTQVEGMITTGATGSTAIISVGLKAASAVSAGSYWIDDISAVKSVTAPAVAVNSIRACQVETDGSQARAVTDLRTMYANFTKPILATNGLVLPVGTNKYVT